MLLLLLVNVLTVLFAKFFCLELLAASSTYYRSYGVFPSFKAPKRSAPLRRNAQIDDFENNSVIKQGMALNATTSYVVF